MVRTIPGVRAAGGPSGPRAREAPRSRLFAVTLALAAAWWVADLALLRSGSPHPLDDTWEDALIARSLIAGHGFHTTMIYPPLFALHDPRTLVIPVLVHGPLGPLMLAPLLAIFGPSCADHTAWLGAIAAWLGAWRTGRLASRVVSPGAGVVAAALFTLSPVMLVAVHHSRSVALGALAVALALDALVRERPRPFLAGLALGMGYLTRPEMLVLAPILVAGAATTWRQAARSAAAFVVCALPWWIHHALAVGAPLFNLTTYTLIAYTPAHPGPSPMRDFALSPQRWPSVLAAQWPTVLAKIPGNLPQAFRSAAKVPSLATGWLMGVGGIAWFSRPRRRRIVAAVSLAAIVPIATMTVTAPQQLYLAPLLPVYALAAAIGVEVLANLAAWRGRARALPALLLLVAFVSVLPAVRVGQREGARARGLLRAERALLSLAGPGAAAGPAGTPPVPMFSDRPDFLSWTTGRPVLWTTAAQYDSLYPGHGARAALPAGLPAGRDTSLTWFHDGYWLTGHRAPR